MDWIIKPEPSKKNKEYFKNFKNQLEFDSPFSKNTNVFARKFTDKRNDIINQIDEEWQH